MKRNVKNIVLSVLLSALLVSVAVGNVFASSHRGSAIYRNKISSGGSSFAGLFGHAGLVIENSLSEYVGCIVHMTGDGYAETCDLSDFLAEGDPSAADEYYLATPLQSMTSTQISNVRAKAIELVNADFNYTMLGQLHYSSARFGAGRVLVPHIIALRCDGLTEYCYEFYNIRIYGSNSDWDVSTATEASYNRHYGFNITPYIQMNNYMEVYYPE